MNLLKYWLFISSVLISLSSSAAVGVSEKSITETNQAQVLLTLNENQLRLLVKRSTFDEPALDNTLPQSLPHRSMVFNSDTQVEPEYQLVFEFAPSDDVFARQYFKEYQPEPWYLSATLGKSRINGWKDSNNLYKASLTYHS